MCGISGFLFNPEFTETQALDGVRLMNDSMSLRGPDAVGSWTGEGIVLGHRRLAILDLDPRANQPMVSADGRFIIVFNGEIYNYRELRQTLENDGAVFRSTSDTEVLLLLFAHEGERMLLKLRGMFAFAIWDTESRELFLACDPYGIKPLYYTNTQQGFIFASQIKALLASRLISAEQEPAGLVGFFLWGSVPEPWTLYRDVFALPAGHWLRIRDGIMEAPVSWHDIRVHWQKQIDSLPQTYLGNAADRFGLRNRVGLACRQSLQERVRETVRESVRAHLVSDVPVSVFLSGGIDSGMIAGLATELGVKVEGISISFMEFEGSCNDEGPDARVIAAHYGLPHHVRQVTRAEFEQDIPSILAAMDQPSIDGVNTWFASKAAAERGYKVALSGLGGDELFCGYPFFRQIPRMVALGRVVAAIPGAGTLLKMPCNWLARCRSQPKYAAIPECLGSLEGGYLLCRGLFMPSELPALMGGVEQMREGLLRLGGTPPGMDLVVARDGVAAVGLLESTYYLRNQLLRDSDWASMGHSLELRTPLVDAKVLEELGPFISDFTSGNGKAMLARSPLKPLPDTIIHRQKTGFVLPMEKWISAISDKSAWSNVPLLAMPGTPWARRWAKTIIAGMPKCE